MWPCIGKNPLDSRLKTSGMTAGAIEHVGHDGGRVVPDFACLCHACPYPLFMPALSLLSCPPLPPLSCPPVLSSVMPAGSPPLSFPQVFSGNPVFFSSVPSFVWHCLGKALDSRLKTSGMTAAGSCRPADPLCSFPLPPLSFPQVFSGNPVFFLFCPFIRAALHGKALDSRLKMSGMTRGELCVPACPL